MKTRREMGGKKWENAVLHDILFTKVVSGRIGTCCPSERSLLLTGRHVFVVFWVVTFRG